MPVAKFSVLGSGLAASDLKQLLNKSYDKTPTSYNDYIVDPALSGRRVQVYRNAKTGKVVVAHRGTEGIHDWITDLRYGSVGAENSNRFRHSRKIQQLAAEKYGKGNLTTIGHSLGGVLAEESAADGEVLTLNKPASMFNAKTNKKQVDIRSSRDPISMFRPMNMNNKNKLITVPSNSFNPFTEHAVASMDGLGDVFIGK